MALLDNRPPYPGGYGFGSILAGSERTANRSFPTGLPHRLPARGGRHVMSEFRQDTYYEEGSDAGGMPGAHVAEFLASPDSTWLLKLAFNKEDGWPMVVPLWYQWDGEAFYVVGRKRSEWVQDLIRNPGARSASRNSPIPASGRYWPNAPPKSWRDRPRGRVRNGSR